MLILTAIPLGVVANGLAYDTAKALAFKAQLFSLHKTIGVAAFLIGLSCILWALSRPHPVPLQIGVQQMGQTVSGTFAVWTAAISLDGTPIDGRDGDVAVTTATDSLTLGSVTAQALTAEFFDAAIFPTATFATAILPAEDGYLAEGTLTLRGVSVPVSLPFTMTVQGGVARMQGRTTRDRRDFRIGPCYPDEKSVGFPVTVPVRLTATQRDAAEQGKGRRIAPAAPALRSGAAYSAFNAST